MHGSMPLALALTISLFWPMGTCLAANAAPNGPEPQLGPRTRAARYFAAGQQAYLKGDFLTAIRAFEQSNQAKPHPSTAFNLAQACRRQYERDADPAQLKRAIDLYGRAIKEAPRAVWLPTAEAELIQLLAIATRRPVATTQPSGADRAAATQLMVTCAAPGARVAIDGEPAGGEPAPAIRYVTPGPHAVRVEAPGYAAHERQVLAVAQRLVVAETALERLPGRLRVLADKDGATVYLDAQTIGRTPLERDGVAPGLHALAVAHSGRRLWRDSVLVESDGTVVAVANLRWSTQRKFALGTGGLGIALATAGLVTGMLALQADASLDSLPQGSNPEREAWTDRLEQRDGLALATTILLSTAGAAAVAAILLYVLDWPPTPVAGSPAGRDTPVARSVGGGFVF